jgi:hypothetical protein
MFCVVIETEFQTEFLRWHFVKLTPSERCQQRTDGQTMRRKDNERFFVNVFATEQRV